MLRVRRSRVGVCVAPSSATRARPPARAPSRKSPVTVDGNQSKENSTPAHRACERELMAHPTCRTGTRHALLSRAPNHAKVTAMCGRNS